MYISGCICRCVGLVGVWKVDVWPCGSGYMCRGVGVLIGICVIGWRSCGLCISRYWRVCEWLGMFYAFF